MDIEFKGGNCVVMSVKKNTLVVDPKISDLGLKDQGANATVHLLTQPQFAAPHKEETLVIDGPGEYEVVNLSVKGIAAKAHLDAPDEPPRATMYKVVGDDIIVAIVGHIRPDLSEEQLEELGVVDVLVVPVGGNGYTLDATGAVDLVRKIAPKVVIPTHFADATLTYPVPQAELGLFLKELGAVHEVTSKLKLKPGLLSDVLTVYELTRVA